MKFLNLQNSNILVLNNLFLSNIYIPLLKFIYKYCITHCLK